MRPIIRRVNRVIHDADYLTRTLLFAAEQCAPASEIGDERFTTLTGQPMIQRRPEQGPTDSSRKCSRTTALPDPGRVGSRYSVIRAALVMTSEQQCIAILEKIDAAYRQGQIVDMRNAVDRGSGDSAAPSSKCSATRAGIDFIAEFYAVAQTRGQFRRRMRAIMVSISVTYRPRLLLPPPYR